MNDEKYFRYLRVRDRAFAAAEGYMLEIRKIFDRALDPLVILQKDGSISVEHKPLPEFATVEELCKRCRAAVDHAVKDNTIPSPEEPAAQRQTAHAESIPPVFS